ncbi:M48 family metalloprotease [Candidatus Poriferisodalis sp.]|uniref:M48 family metalloprotease n=1 Tax=Candidatus Poriferisodalis sp. TaxID=3101277 RepID=UPI003B013F0E
MAEAPVDQFGTFDEGCMCGEVLDHLSVCVSFVRRQDGDGSAFPASEVRRYRECVLGGVSPASGLPLDAAGWLSELEESDERFVNEMLVAAEYVGLDEDRILRGASGARATITWRRAGARRAADAAQWRVTLQTAIPEEQAPSWAQLAACRRRSVVAALSAPHEIATSSATLRTFDHSDLVEVGDDAVALRLPRYMAVDHGDPRSPVVGALALRKCVARWMHIAWVLYPTLPPADSGRSGSGSASVVVIARAYRERPADRPATRFLRVANLPRAAADLKRLAADLLDDASDDADHRAASAIEWPAERMVAGHWPALCVESNELVDVAWQLRSGELFAVESLRERGWFWPVPTFAESRARDIGGVVETRTPAGAAADGGPGEGIWLGKAVADPPESWNWRLRLISGIAQGDPRLASVVSQRDVDRADLAPGRRGTEDAKRAPSWEKSMAMWFNSSLGALGILAAAAPRGGDEYWVDQLWLRQMAVPPLDDTRKTRLAAAHDRLGSGDLLPLGDAPNDPARIAIDDAVCRAIGIDSELMARVRSLLAAESAIGHRPDDKADLGAQHRQHLMRDAVQAAEPIAPPAQTEQRSARPSPAQNRRRVGDWSSWSAATVLLLLLPVSVFCSMALLFPLALFWPNVYWAVAVYFALGFIVLIPGVEDAFWGLIFSGGREPRPHERVRLTAAWSQVIERSGRTDGSLYRLQVIDTDEINAMAGGGHQVFVTTSALAVMSDEVLPGVLAHELGHHVGLHPIVLGLEIWFMRPVIWAQYAAVALSNLSAAITGAFRGGILMIIVGIVALILRAAAWTLIAVTWLAFAALRRAGRGAEYRADRYAAQIGFGHELAGFLQTLRDYERHIDTDAQPTFAEIISSTHPPTAERLRRLRPYLR